MAQTRLADLDSGQQEVLSRIKARVILGLLEVLTEKDNDSRSIVERQRYTLQLQVIGGPSCHIEAENGVLIFREARCRFPSLTLFFVSPLAMNRMFSGYKQNPLPLPGSFRFPAIISSFRQLSGRLSYFMEGEGRNIPENRALVTELLLFAAMYGVSIVGEYDEYVAARVEQMPDGVVEVSVPGKKEINAWLVKEGAQFSVFRVRPEKRANALLRFGTTDCAFDVLTGSRKAMGAMGTGEVAIRGRLPLIQTVFQLLDRVGFYMAVK